MRASSIGEGTLDEMESRVALDELLEILCAGIHKNAETVSKMKISWFLQYEIHGYRRHIDMI